MYRQPGMYGMTREHCRTIPYDTLNRARLKGHTAAIIAGIALDERDRFRAAKKHILQMVGAENWFRNWFRPPHRSRPILPLVTRDPSMRRCHSRDHTGAGNGGLGGWRVRGPDFRSCYAAVVGWARSHGRGPSTFRFPNASAWAPFAGPARTPHPSCGLIGTCNLLSSPSG